MLFYIFFKICGENNFISWMMVNGINVIFYLEVEGIKINYILMKIDIGDFFFIIGSNIVLVGVYFVKF